MRLLLLHLLLLFHKNTISFSIPHIKELTTDNKILPEFETSLTSEDFKASKFVSRLNKINPSLQNLTLDDIRVRPPAIPGEIRPITALNSLFRRWPKGIIPYTISSSYNWLQKALIALSFEAYHANTNIRFVPKEPHHWDYIYIHPERGCWSYIGRQGGRQELSLSSGCFYGSTVLHELMHAVGFDHEQNRSDRDDYVTINWENIEKGMESNFFKVSPFAYSNIAGGYDYGSIMHYPILAFSKNWLMTIVPKQPIGYIMGLAFTFSRGDIDKLNTMYPKI